MADKFKRYTNSIKIFYKRLDDVITHYGDGKHKILMFGSGTPANMAIYYLKIHNCTVTAILDNNPNRKPGAEEYGVRIFRPEEYLSDFDDTVRIMIASSHEAAMEAQLRELGYNERHIIRLLDFQKTMADYSFAGRTGQQELIQQEVRKRQLKILHHLKDLCDKHGLRYWLCYGTLLGAVRHQGFIPWDDDIDVFVEMKDLKKLAMLLHEDTEYGMATFVDEEMDFCDFCSYMYETASDMDINYFPMQASLGVSIDIFPLVGVPAEERERQRYIAELKRKNEEVWSRMYSKEELRSKTTELFTFMSSYDFDECESCGNVLGIYYTKEIWDTVCFNNTQNLIFEGESYLVPAGWADYLESIYGKDYMTPPPETERVSHHNYKAYMPKGENRGGQP